MDFIGNPCIDKKCLKTHGSAAVMNVFIIPICGLSGEPIDKKSWKTHGSAAVMNVFIIYVDFLGNPLIRRAGRPMGQLP